MKRAAGARFEHRFVRQKSGAAPGSQQIKYAIAEAYLQANR
jgi:hypothetical protein